MQDPLSSLDWNFEVDFDTRSASFHVADSKEPFMTVSFSPEVAYNSRYEANPSHVMSQLIRLIAVAPMLSDVVDSVSRRWDNYDEDDNPELGKAIRNTLFKRAHGFSKE
jgi:hypothetical protein